MSNHGYVYIQNNSIIDDSWLGTSALTIKAPTFIQPKNTTSISTNQISDSTWLGNFFKNKTPINPIQGVLPVVTQSVPYPMMPIVYTTPNGTLLNNITSSYTAPTPIVSDFLTFGTGISRVGNSIGLIPGANGEILSMASGIPTWVTPTAVSVPVFSVFGRTSSILATLGDYTTNLVTEGASLYFTDARAQNALSGSIVNISNTINTLSGSLITLSSRVDTLSGVVANNYMILSGALATTNKNLSSLSGTVNTFSGFVSTLLSTISTLSGSLAIL